MKTINCYEVDCALGSCTFKDLNLALDEIKMHLEEGLTGITIKIRQMTEEEYENLPEFQGY